VMPKLIQVDGSHGEGGGQIIRTAVSLAAITGCTVEIDRIRAARSRPGLQAQHLAAVRAAGQICGADLRGDAVGSSVLRFEPTHEIRPGHFLFDIGTAGATTLVAQTLIVPLALAGASTVTIRGGTHNPMAPTADYLEHVYAGALRMAGYRVSTEYGPPGFYPRGGGELRLELDRLDRGSPFELVEQRNTNPTAFVVTSSLEGNVADRAETAILARAPMAVVKRVERGPGAGAAVTIVAGSAGFSALGERGKPMERVAGDAVDRFLAWRSNPVPVDEHLADQLVLPSLFARGESTWRTVRFTEHLKTVVWLAAKFCAFDHSLDETTGMVHIRPSQGS
jgi:RNA 3'-terminal phosphate cyclase (ATP)